jgi:hypothetical protein
MEKGGKMPSETEVRMYPKASGSGTVSNVAGGFRATLMIRPVPSFMFDSLISKFLSQSSSSSELSALSPTETF